MPNAYGYLWLAPRVLPEQEFTLTQDRQIQLQTLCQAQKWQWQGLEVDRSLSTQAAERPLLKRRLKSLKDSDILLVQSTLDLGRRFYDVFALMELFRQSASLGSLIIQEQDLKINHCEGSEVLMILSRIPQLNCKIQQTTLPAHRSEVSKVNGGACPYGYEIHPDSNEYILIEAEAQIIQRIFKERARGRSLRQIALKLTQDQIPTKRGGRWHANTIKSILENPFYTGVYQTHYAKLEHHHPEIISEALFYEINGHLFCDDIAL